MSKWDNKDNVIDRAEKMGLIGEKKDGPFVSGCSWAEPTREKQKIEHNAVKKGKLFLVTSDMERSDIYRRKLCSLLSGQWGMARSSECCEGNSIKIQILIAPKFV